MIIDSGTALEALKGALQDQFSLLMRNLMTAVAADAADQMAARTRCVRGLKIAATEYSFLAQNIASILDDKKEIDH